ncbi:MAG TPA: hypothetical protein DD454_02070 [Candidatus Moranbacteria bacterium]|nr:hypothetical protein [Candidatus Moranbacteria bacterium]
MLSAKNLLKPASGEPIAVPSKDIVLGVYYITHTKNGVKGEGKIFSSADEAILAYQSNAVAINAKVKLDYEGSVIETSVGRIILNDILPEELRFINEELTAKDIKVLVAKYLALKGQEETAKFIDRIKKLGFDMATRSGISWGMDDLKVPAEKKAFIEKAEADVETVNSQYNMGLLTNEERKARVIEVWNRAKNAIADTVKASLDKEGPVYTMVHSKARGSESVVVQMMGMKGLVAGPTGETIELPVKSSFKEGFNVLEYFISTHGARKGMADTALRTATAGYLTRRLVDVSQDIIVREDDCQDKEGSFLYRSDSDRIGLSFAPRVEGRYVAENVADPKTGEIIIKKGTLVEKAVAKKIDESGVPQVKIRSVVTCKTKRGICKKCYGVDLGRSEIVQTGQAVGIVAAQAIGEPGTQLTMRTFHIGGVAGSDITQGLPRVEEIFEARPPKGEAVIIEVDGKVVDIIDENKKTITVKIEVQNKAKDIKEYQVPSETTLIVEKGQLIGKGTALNEGHIDLKKLYETMGKEEVQRYIVREIQEIYASQGEGISDKHIEVIVRQMFSRMKIVEAGDTDLIPGDVVEKDQFNEANEEALAGKGEAAIGEELIMGITKVALSTESFLSAASFQETARVLINAAVTGKDDKLRGLKENVIIGRLIPAGTGYREIGK